jgi:hypothetical protein
MPRITTGIDKAFYFVNKIVRADEIRRIQLLVEMTQQRDTFTKLF